MDKTLYRGARRSPSRQVFHNKLRDRLSDTRKMCIIWIAEKTKSTVRLERCFGGGRWIYPSGYKLLIHLPHSGKQKAPFARNGAIGGGRWIYPSGYKLLIHLPHSGKQKAPFARNGAIGGGRWIYPSGYKLLIHLPHSGKQKAPFVWNSAIGGGRWIRTTEAIAADLQSVPFGHSGIPPYGRYYTTKSPFCQ